MDWFGFEVPIYSVIEVEDGRLVSPPMDWLALVPTAIMVAAVIAIVAVALRRRGRRSFWCAIAGRDVVVALRRGRPCACSAFEDPGAITCARRCTDPAFRRQWPPALPLLRTATAGRRVV
jgi:hypothetical protein